MELKIILDTTPLCSSLSNILPIRVMEVCTTPWEKVWDHVVKEYHYLGYQKMFGPRLKYLIFTGERPIAAISFNQSFFMVEARDCFIGCHFFINICAASGSGGMEVKIKKVIN